MPKNSKRSPDEGKVDLMGYYYPNAPFPKWLRSNDIFPDLKTMTDVSGNPEEERHTDFYYQPWAQEAVCRYFYQKITQKRSEIESSLGLKS